MIKQKLTVSVGIPAHNEERNIGKLLGQIFDQKATKYKLQEVIVVCDGCTDNTAEIVSSIAKKHKEVRLLDDGKRQGKASRINYLYKNHLSDILICVDADIQLGSKLVFEEIVTTFLEGKADGLVGCNDKPHSARNFFESVVVSWIKNWQRTTRPLYGYDNPHNCHGCIYGISKRLSRAINIPASVAAEDHYIYYKSKELGFSFAFSPQAIVYFRAPKTYRDFLNQSTRFGNSGADVSKIFENLAAEYEITANVRFKEYLRSAIHEPIRFPLALVLQLAVKLNSYISVNNYSHGIWTTVKSSK
jgi:glycosyltransferase involved in cell wall biosynthesis